MRAPLSLSLSLPHSAVSASNISAKAHSFEDSSASCTLGVNLLVLEWGCADRSDAGEDPTNPMRNFKT